MAGASLTLVKLDDELNELLRRSRRCGGASLLIAQRCRWDRSCRHQLISRQRSLRQRLEPVARGSQLGGSRKRSIDTGDVGLAPHGVDGERRLRGDDLDELDAAG